MLKKCEEKLAKEAGQLHAEAEKEKQKKDDDVLMTLTVVFSLIVSIALFMMLPYFISRWMRTVIHSEILIVIAEGIVRLVIFFSYLALVSRMKDIQRTFMYHGAEHKCINCIEHGLELNVENVRISSREHKRCGTSFLFIVMFISIVFIMVFSIPLFMVIHVNTSFWRIVLRLLLLPLIAGVSYEFIRLAGTSESRIVSILSRPGMMLQHLTTKEPDDSMIEVAIASVEAVFDWKKFENEQFGTHYELDQPKEDAEKEAKCRTGSDCIEGVKHMAGQSAGCQTKASVFQNREISGGEAVRCAAQYLAAHQIEDADNDAWLLFSYVTHITRAMFLAERRARMDQEALERYEALLVRRAAHIPLQHLTGEQEFMGFPFQVNEHVLVPRQDTEILVEEALKVLAPGDHVLDLCTGSGCIAISLWKLCTGLTVDAADLSAEALAVAKENAKALEAGVAFFRGDLFEAVTGRQMYDCIVSNPPYIRTEVIETLSEEVRAHEPYQALDGKEDGLYFYREIVRKSGSYLKPGGHLLFEIGYDQAEAVSMLMQTQGYEEIEVIRDLAGLDRVVKGKRKQEELHV